MIDDFGLRALVVGLGVACFTGPLGCFVVWRRMAFFGGTLAHSALLGVALGFLLGIDVTLGVAAVGVYVAVRDAYRMHRHMTHTWLIGLGSALASNDVRIWRVIALFGSLAAARAALEHAQHFSRVLLTRWGTAILEVRR